MTNGPFIDLCREIGHCFARLLELLGPSESLRCWFLLELAHVKEKKSEGPTSDLADQIEVHRRALELSLEELLDSKDISFTIDR